MAKLTLTGSEFCDLIECFLYDKLNNPDEIIEFDVNERFNAFMEVMARRGTKGPLLQCYMDMDPQLRVKYRMIRSVFIDGGTSIATIEIHNDKRPEVAKVGFIARIKNYLKKILTLGLMGNDEPVKKKK